MHISAANSCDLLRHAFQLFHEMHHAPSIAVKAIARSRFRKPHEISGVHAAFFLTAMYS